MRSRKLAITLGALALGTAITVLPALAQEYHNSRAANDGGPLTASGQTAQTQSGNTGARTNASVAQNATQRNLQDNAQSRQQENVSDNDRRREATTSDERASNVRASQSGQARPRVTRRMTMIRRFRPTARTETTARSENSEYLRSAAGPTDVAVNAAPPQRQYYGANGPAGGFGDRYYDQYSENYGDEGFAPSAGFGPNPGVRAAAAMNENDIAACQMRFQSFDPASGTYLGYDGMRHPCP